MSAATPRGCCGRTGRTGRTGRGCSGLVGLLTGAISTAQEPTQPAGLADLFIVQAIRQAMAQSGIALLIADTGGQQGRAAS